MQALTVYQHLSTFLLPLLGILWGMVALRTVQVWQPELALVRQSVHETLVIRSIGRPLPQRVYDSCLCLYDRVQARRKGTI